MLVVLIVVVIFEYFHQDIVITPISVPKTLSDQGITDVVAAEELRQAIYDTVQPDLDANANKYAKAYSRPGGVTPGGVPGREPYIGRGATGQEPYISPYRSSSVPKVPAALSNELPDIAVPTTGISIDTILKVLADVLPKSQEKVVSGDFIGDKNELTLVVSVNEDQVFLKSGHATLRSANTLIDDAAKAVVTNTHPDWAAVYFSQHGRMRDADRLMEMIINSSRDPNSEVAEAHLVRGIFLRQEQSPEAACAEFKKSLDMDPGNPVAYRYISVLLTDEHKLDLATAEAKKAVILSWGRDSWNYYALGTSYYLQKKWPQAEDGYRNAIRISYENTLAHDALGRVEETEGDSSHLSVSSRVAYLSDARSEFDKAIAINGHFFDALDDQGTLLINENPESRDYREEAREDFAHARDASSEQPWPYIGLGYVNFYRGDYRHAADNFLAALRLDSSLTFAFNNALDALKLRPENRDLQNELNTIETSKKVCGSDESLPVQLTDQPIVRDLVRARCHAKHVAHRRRVPACKADSGQISVLPSDIIIDAFAVADQIEDHRQLAASILLVFAGSAIYGLRRWRRTVRPRDPGTVSDTGENTDRRGPEA